MKRCIHKHTLLIILFTTISFLGCNDNSNNEGEQDITPNISVSDIIGVWVCPEKSPDDLCLYYLAIYPNGRYNFCFGKDLMGSGFYSLEKSTLVLRNGYSFSIDKIELNEFEKDKSMYISGHFASFYNDRTINYFSTLKKTDEKLSQSVVGVEKEPSGLSGLHKYYSDFDTKLFYMTEYIAKYTHKGKLRSTGRWETLKDITWYYTYRHPYTYTQEVGGDGKVKIYKFDYDLELNEIDQW